MTIKFPTIVAVISLLAASSLGACGSDSSDSPPPGTGGGPATGCNNNNVVEGAEQCDGTNLNGKTCAALLMNQNATGNPTCVNCTFVTTGCVVPGGTGGRTGTGGGTGTGAGP